MARASKPAGNRRPSEAGGEDRDKLFNGNATIPVSLLRLATPSGVIAILAVAVSIGGKINGIENAVNENCQSTYQRGLALYREHRNDKYSGSFPKPIKPDCAN